MTPMPTADRYAGPLAPAEGERVAAGCRIPRCMPIPARAIGLSAMGGQHIATA